MGPLWDFDLLAIQITQILNIIRVGGLDLTQGMNVC